jgi:hypothetical protein
MTIDPIVNAMMSIEVLLHILQQGPNEGTLSFETHDHAIRNILKDINVIAKKSRTQSRKNQKQNPREQKLVL